MRIDALKRGFLTKGRRIIGLDCCFLKGAFEGRMLSAMGKDGNNKIYPMTQVVVKFENEDNWN